jgi:protein-L-isoaspartate O-methyltransferase
VDALGEAARAAGVQDERVLSAIAAEPRLGFMPPAHTEHPNIDTPIPIPHAR